MVEQICALLRKAADLGFYRTAAGAELDVVVQWGSKKLDFEIKFSSAPKVTKGFWLACEDLALDHAYVLAPVGDESVGPLHHGCHCAFAVAVGAVALNWP